MVPHILKRDSSVKTTWCQSACQVLCSRAHSRRSRRWFAMRGILYKGTLARNPRCNRRQRIDEADVSIPVAVDQRAVNCLRKLYGHFPSCGTGVDRHVLTSPSIVH
ncbi:uncharacterized protein TNCV_295681 [Trichonephila clavipes]|nr:uncharacterized protein TNCV_295681 [Trichonephila clavipes]